MTRDEFVAAVMAQLQTIPDPRDEGLVRSDAGDLFDDRYEVSEAVALLRCREEVNPDLPEGIALSRMSQIVAAHKARIGD